MAGSGSQSRRFPAIDVPIWNGKKNILCFISEQKREKFFLFTARLQCLHRSGHDPVSAMNRRLNRMTPGSSCKTCTYLRVKGMLKVIQSPAKYLQGPDASTLFGQYAKNLADSFFL